MPHGVFGIGNRLERGRAVLKRHGATKRSPFRYFKTSSEIIRPAVMLCVRFPLSLRIADDLLHERGVEISHETGRWLNNRGRTRTRLFDDENGPCFDSGACEFLGNLPPPPICLSKITSTSNATHPAERISSKPRRRFRRKAPPLCGMSGRSTVRSGTGSHLSDSTATCHRKSFRGSGPQPQLLSFSSVAVTPPGGKDWSLVNLARTETWDLLGHLSGAALGRHSCAIRMQQEL